MKIIKLKAENVKRLSAVEITPDGNTVIIGGKNEAGKSSVLDAIAMALGGAKLAPPQPIRTGQNDATIEVDLGDYVVTRRFKRVFKEVGSDQPDVPTNEFTSTLVVTSKPKGDEPAARFASPQAMLDKLLGALSFDPLTFATAHGTDQSAILQRIVKLDTSDLDQTIKDLEAKRTEASRQLRQATANLSAVTRHEDAPANRVSAAELADELEAAQNTRDVATKMAQLVDIHTRAYDKIRASIVLDHEQLLKYEQQIEDITRAMDTVGARIAADEHNLELQANIVRQSRENLETAQAAIPDIDAIKTRVKQVEDLNRKFEANRAADEAQAYADDARDVLNAIVDNLEAARDAREARIKEAKFPVEGLAFGENGVLYKDIPFEQASTAVKLRVSVAIGLALNPALKVLLIREGAFLDEDNLKLVGELANEAGAQVWIERVGTQGVSVIIEDGHVA
jgi:DNA repair exonuclease SbcCD ATPase subunit